MRLYLAASFTRRAEIRGYANDLRALGHVVVSTWHDHTPAGVQDDGVTMAGSEKALTAIAVGDLREVAACEVLVAFTGIGPEEWRPVVGYEGRYEVSSAGRVRGMQSSDLFQRECRGWLLVELSMNGRKKRIPIHRLVTSAFLDAQPEGTEINHRDGNKRNNRPENLEYITHAENVKHAWAVGCCGSRQGESNANSKLTFQQVEEIRARWAQGEHNKAKLAREYGVGDTAIYGIISGRRWQAHTRERPVRISILRPDEAADFESGFAFGLGKSVWIVGPRTVILHHYHALPVFPDWDAARAHLTEREEANARR